MGGLRFDLTMPLARFAAQHINELGTPFKRYHIATVWRGETPQEGRYREFMQCDFDTIGTRSTASDIETALVIHDLLRAIGIRDFTIRLNNRMLLTGLLERQGLVERSRSVLRALDKLGKIGPDKVAEEMVATAGTTPEQAREVLRLTEIAGANDEVLRQVEPLVAGNVTGETGVGKLRETLAALAAVGVAEPFVKLDVSIARGLDYYTGTIFETFLNELPSIGSICSGGRYDNLAELYTNQELPGIGPRWGSIDCSRRWKSSGSWRRLPRPPPSSFPISTRPTCTTICVGRRAADGGHWRGGLSRGEEARPAVEVCRPPRLPHRLDCRPERVRSRRLPAQGSPARREERRAAGRRLCGVGRGGAARFLGDSATRRMLPVGRPSCVLCYLLCFRCGKCRM